MCRLKEEKRTGEKEQHRKRGKVCKIRAFD
jgi:hypothetical protein